MQSKNMEQKPEFKLSREIPYTRPLVTFILIAYNQERLIREAVEGAFSQTYSPLEILLSDDCSTDRTYEIMKEMAAQYTGPHKIILNRNERNLGICGHVNRCVELTHGELIVCAAGDDISLPHRCARLAEEWNKDGRKWHSIYSNAIIINQEGHEVDIYLKNRDNPSITVIEDVLKGGIAGVPGCTHAFSRYNYIIFGDLTPLDTGEDDWLGVRSCLLGGVLYVPDKLVKYRRHEQNIFVTVSEFSEYHKKEKKRKLNWLMDGCNAGLRENIRNIAIAYQKIS